MPRRYFLVFYVLFPLLHFNLNAQVTVDFNTISDTIGCGSLQASFCAVANSTEGNIVKYSWSLGGINSTLECPGRIFGTSGAYTICLEVTDDKGNKAQKCKEDHIKIFALPEPAFDAIPTQGCAPLEVVFEDQSTSTDGKIIKWIWGLGGSSSVVIDNGTATEIKTIYTLSDNYSVNLTVEDENGCMKTITKDNFINIFPDPEIIVTTQDSFSCSAPYNVTFLNESPAQNITYFWDFGNGNVYAGYQPPPIDYDESGTYTINVVAQVPSSGCRATLVLEDKVSVGFPVSFSVSENTTCAGETIVFKDDSNTPADSILWDFGDGNTATSVTANHEYENAGTYTVTLFRFVAGCPSKKIEKDFILVKEIPDVDYSNDNSFGCSVPHVVNFAATSNGATTWAWDFGDGKTSSEKDPVHIYNAFGEYIVKLTVTNSETCSNTVSRDTIVVAPLEAALFMGDVEGCAPITFTLEDNSKSVVPISSWDWSVGNFSSTASSPNFTLYDTGRYDVQLIVENTLNCRDTILEEDFLRVGDKLKVDFDADTKENCVGAPVAFTDLSSEFADSWSWLIGDTVLFGQNPIYEFSDTGTFDVTLVVGQNGCISDTLKDSFIKIVEPKAAFKFKQFCTSPFKVNFENRSIGADALEWDFGVSGIQTDTSSELNPTFLYPTTGEYEITLTAINYTTGCSHTVTKIVVITNPRADFVLSTLSGCVPLKIKVLDNSDFATEWIWSAPGGVISNPNSAEPIITYNTAGTYSVIQLVVTDVNECKDTLVFTDSIRVDGVVASFLNTPKGACTPFNVDFTDQSTSVFGNNVKWEWEIGNAHGLMTGQQPSFLFEERGAYNVSLKVTDDWGCVGTVNVPDAVLATDPIADFIADTLSCTVAEVNFKTQSNGIDLSFVWDFGDGGSSTDSNPTHLYTEEGIYTACLRITDINGCTDQICKQNYIVIADPVANFQIDETYASCPPLVAQFNNMSQNSNTYEWDFGDNSGVGDLENPPHVYTSPGVYTVSLIASSTKACTDTLILENLVQLDGPTGSFSFKVDTSCVPVKVTLTGMSDDFYEYVWDMGNGDLVERSGLLQNDEVVYYYPVSGIFSPNLILKDANTACEVVIESDQDVFVSVLAAEFTAIDSTLCDGDFSTQFINLSSSNAPITFLEWNFEGGTPEGSDQFEPQVSFGGTGAYDVQLIVGNEYCKDTIIKEGYLRIGVVPDADFTFTPDQGCEPLPIQFADNSSVGTGTVTDWFWDFGDEAASYDENPQHTFGDGGAYNIQMIVTTDFGCTDTATAILNVEDAMTIEIAEIAPICIGEHVPLDVAISDTTGISIVWENATSLDCTDCIDPVASPTDTTTYVIKIENDVGCKNEAELTINVRPFSVPVISLTPDTSICSNDIINLVAGGGDDIFSYDWDTSSLGLSCYTNCNTPIASPTDTTTYRLVVTSNEGCSSTDSVTVFVASEFQTFASEDKTICEGDTINLSIAYGTNPIWLNPKKLECAYCPAPYATPNEDYTYFVQVTDPLGCEIKDSVIIDVVRRSEVDAGEDMSLCMGANVQLNGIGDGAVSWSPSIGITGAASLTPTVSPSTNTIYFLTVSSGDCVMKDSILIEVISKVDIALEGSKICEGEEVELQVEGNADTFEWSPNDKVKEILISSILVDPKETTTYEVIGKMSTCEPDTVYAKVEVIPAPNFKLPLARGFFKDQEFEIGFENSLLGNFVYQWLPSDGLSCIDCPNPIVSPDSSRVYSVVVINPLNGCSTQSSINLQLITECQDEIIGVPNAFSPNNDGTNDELKIFSSVVTEIEKFQVFDRWGGLIFETKDISEGWDGTYNGQILDRGVFIYFIEARCEIDNKTFKKFGDVTLIR